MSAIVWQRDFKVNKGSLRKGRWAASEAEVPPLPAFSPAAATASKYLELPSLCARLAALLEYLVQVALLSASPRPLTVRINLRATIKAVQSLPGPSGGIADMLRK
jgi:hypothetical protein